MCPGGSRCAPARRERSIGIHDMPSVFQIEMEDNVATALEEVKVGETARILGDHADGAAEIAAAEDIPVGHKIALRDIAAGEEIRKYNVVIGAATKDIPKGSWVHLHVMKSLYDERSSHLDVMTGAPKDTHYD